MTSKLDINVAVDLSSKAALVSPEGQLPGTGKAGRAGAA